MAVTEHDLTYREGAEYILFNGVKTGNRTNTQAIKVFGYAMSFDLFDGFTAPQSKRFSMDNVIRELHWFLNGDTNIQYLRDGNCHIWDEWANKENELGPVYGAQWRNREEVIRLDKNSAEASTMLPNILNTTDGRGEYTIEETESNVFLYRNVDQVQTVIDQLLNNPDDRRIIVDAWNTTVLPVPGVDPAEQPAHGRQALAPCHVLFQFGSRPIQEYEGDIHARGHHIVEVGPNGIPTIDGHEVPVAMEDLYDVDGFHTALQTLEGKDPLEKRVLDLCMYQRSMDYLLGAPYNIASYSALLCYIAHRTGHLAGSVHIFVGDMHLYVNHVPQIREQVAYIDKSTIDGRKQHFVTYNVPADLRNMDATNWRIFNQTKGPVIKGKVAR